MIIDPAVMEIETPPKGRWTGSILFLTDKWFFYQSEELKHDVNSRK